MISVLCTQEVRGKEIEAMQTEFDEACKENELADVTLEEEPLLCAQ